MKKLLMILITLFVTSIFVFGQTITVTSPAAGNEWARGTSHNITWRTTGTMDEDVKIRLINTAGVKVLDITDNTDNDGSFESWMIPGTISEGTYTIRVKTLDNRVSGESPGFRIILRTPMTEPVIEVTSPDSSSSWNIGTRKTIRWNKSGDMDSRVRINLMNSSSTAVALEISTNTSNDQEHPWDIPITLSSGRYKVKVTTFDGSVLDESPIFRITALPTMTLPENNVVESRRVIPGGTQPVIRVIYPNGGETLMRGSRVEIRWQCVDGFNPPKIKIQKNGRTVKTYGPDRLYPIPSRGEYIYAWIIPSSLDPGTDYKVRIEKGDFSRSNDKSDRNFTISSDLNLTVTEPNGRGLVATNGTFIRWRAGGVEGNVNVHLKGESSGGLYPIRNNIPASPSSFLWYVGDIIGYGGGAIPNSGDRYMVVVTAVDGSASAESNSFQIMKPTLEVISPGSSEKRRGDHLDIQWNNSRGFHGNVNVILQRQSGGSYVVYDTLFTNTHDKTLRWRIPPEAGFGEADLDPFPTGRYRICIRSVRCPRLILAWGSWFRVR